MDENDDREDVQMDEDGAKNEEERVYLPGDPIEEDEELTYDKSAYHLYHAAQTGAPCLSFDIIQDALGDNRTEFPMTCYLVCGTQADVSSSHSNQVIVMKMTDLKKIDSDTDSENSYIDDEEDGPRLQTHSLKHVGGVNRVRASSVNDKKIVATWSDTGKVHIWDATNSLKSLDSPGAQDHQSSSSKPLHSFSGHQSEGFALDWSLVTPGRLASGSCNRNIHLWQMQDGGSWNVDQKPLNAHTDSVEDIQWSPNEATVFASCSVDQTIRIWDARGVGSKACMITCKAHDADVNVISWNRNDPFIVSGGDDGILKVWDLRKIQHASPVAMFKHHSGPITSVEWHPSDSTVFAASGADNQITLWDLAVEKDEVEAENFTDNARPGEVPPQLLFIHMGQTDIKELHWHKQLPGVIISTAASGFNIFKTISV